MLLLLYYYASYYSVEYSLNLELRIKREENTDGLCFLVAYSLVREMKMNKILTTYMAAGSEFIVMIQVAEMECSVFPYLNSICSQDPISAKETFS